MATGPDQASEWSSIVVPAAAVTVASILAFIGSYFKKAAEPSEATPPGEIAKRAIGAAFPTLDSTTSAAIVNIDVNVARLVKMANDRADRDREDEIAEKAAERAAEVIERRNQQRKE